MAQLADAIGGQRVSGMTLKRFIEGETNPHETTEYAIRSYLERIAQERSA